MPASAPRTRMPHNNKMSASGALRTNDTWSKMIGYDPYANKDDTSAADEAAAAEQAAGLMLLAKMSNLSGILIICANLCLFLSFD